LRFYNPSGQLNTIIESNPGNGEGHASFANAGGDPMAMTLGHAPSISRPVIQLLEGIMS
jgi:hypothetical protein